MADRTKMIGSLLSYFGSQGIKDLELEQIKTRLSSMSDQELMQATKQFESMKKGGRVGLEEGGFLSKMKNLFEFDPNVKTMIEEAREKGMTGGDIVKMIGKYSQSKIEAKKKASKKAGGGMVDKSLY